jgi:hypothetical protein
VSTAVRPHVHVPDPRDLLGQACLACPLGKSNRRVHVERDEVPADQRYEPQNEPSNPKEETL